MRLSTSPDRDEARARATVHAAMVLRRFLTKPEMAKALIEPAPAPGPNHPERSRGIEVLLLMGLQGAGKTTNVAAAMAKGAQRLNRDLEQGTLAKLHEKLGLMLRSGVERVVLDNTYVTRAQRRGAIDAATKHGVPVHGIWHEIDPAQAQVNVVLRMLEVHGRLLEPAELNGRTPDTIGPLVLPRTAKTVETPGDDEGFTSLTRVPFVRRPWPDGSAALFLGIDQLRADGTWLPDAARAIAERPEAPRVLLGWKEGGVTPPAGVINAVCPHPGGPPTCWCRPPLPGLVLQRAKTSKISLTQSRLVSSSPSLATLARVLGVET